MRAILQVASLIVVLLIGVFIGINSAEKNMQKIQATEGTAPRAIQITPQNGKIEISVLGQVIDAKTPTIVSNHQTAKSTNEPTAPIPQGTVSIGNQVGLDFRTAAREMTDILFGWLK